MLRAELTAILSHWGDFEVVEPLKGGHRNQVFRVRGQKGDFVLKSTRRSEASIAWLMDVHVVARSTGIVVPALVQSNNGSFVCDGWTLEQFVEGSHPKDLPTDWLHLTMCEFHAATARFRQRPGFASSTELISVDIGGDIDFRQMPEELVVAIRDAWQSAGFPPMGVIHGDINPSNIVTLPDGGYALLDWDESRVDFQFYDGNHFSTTIATSACKRAAQAYEIACSWHVEPEYAQRLTHAFLAE